MKLAPNDTLGMNLLYEIKYEGSTVAYFYTQKRDPVFYPKDHSEYYIVGIVLAFVPEGLEAVQQGTGQILFHPMTQTAIKNPGWARIIMSHRFNPRNIPDLEFIHIRDELLPLLLGQSKLFDQFIEWKLS